MLSLSEAEYILDMYEKANIRNLRIKVGTDLDYNEEIFKAFTRKNLGRKL